MSSSARSYCFDGKVVFQEHPQHGRRAVFDASGNGQLAWVGEVMGYLVVFDRWSVMGSDEGSVFAYDPDTLERIVSIPLLDPGLAGVIGAQFLAQKRRFGILIWSAWSLETWDALGEVEEVTGPDLEPLEKQLVLVMNLPRVASSTFP